ncbi:MAG: hypothetical protein LUC47_11080 [Clostridiales bacterium]|nr:hypothetical protein [Clostridiales bacterium]
MQQILQKQQKTVAEMMKLWHNLSRKKVETLFFCAKRDTAGTLAQMATQKSPKDRPQQRAKSGEKKKFL